MQINTDLGAGVLTISGAAAIIDVAELRDALRGFIGEVPRPVLDLSQVDTCDTAVLQLLWAARKTAENSDKHLKLTGISETVQAAAAVLGLDFEEGPEDGAQPQRGDHAGAILAH
ncbi:hypothetical protein SBA3_1540005 [Candidatus Sulfopaludibacter sp. SbA3]|nr:hypothetical protein SBA3_1540005 [Candidatus Sulfopaludibacter sp. SbA3]